MGTGGQFRSVRRRAVFLVGGYERNDSAGFFARMRRELSRFSACWGVTAETGAAVFDEVHHCATATIKVDTPMGVTETQFTFLDYADIVRRDSRRPLVVRFLAWLAAFADYVATGTAWRFFTANWRFGLYFLYPAVAICVSLFFGWVGAKLLLAAMPGAGTAGAAIVMIAVAGFFLWRFSSRLYLFHLMDLWSFSLGYLRGRRSDGDARTSQWAEKVAACLGNSDMDEVILVGHSTGGALATDIAAMAAEITLAAGNEPHFHLLTVGSTGLKIYLHPAAKRSRDNLDVLAAQPGIKWTEYQALTDIINFYKCDPFAMAGKTHQRSSPFPRIWQVRFKHMLDAAFYRRIKRNFFRVHYQFISANTKPHFYDFWMMTLGPLSIDETSASNDWHTRWKEKA